MILLIVGNDRNILYWPSVLVMAMAIRIDDGHKPQQQYGDQPNNDDVDNYNNDDE